MRIVRRLGSQFMAFLSGAVLATGLAILATLLLQDQRPALYGLVFGSTGLVILGSAIAGWVSVVTGDLEALELHEEDAGGKDEIWEAEKTRITVLLVLALSLTVGGLMLLPVRLAWRGWGPAPLRQCDPVTKATAPAVPHQAPCGRSR